MDSSLMNTPQPHEAKKKSKRRQRTRGAADGKAADARRQQVKESAAAVVQAHMQSELQSGELHLQEPLGGDEAAMHAPLACVFAGRWRSMPAAIRYVTFHAARSMQNMSSAHPEEALATALAADVTGVYSLSHPNIVATFQHSIRVAETPPPPCASARTPASSRHSRTSSGSGMPESPTKCVQLLIVQVSPLPACTHAMLASRFLRICACADAAPLLLATVPRSV